MALGRDLDQRGKDPIQLVNVCTVMTTTRLPVALNRTPNITPGMTVASTWVTLQSEFGNPCPRLKGIRAMMNPASGVNSFAPEPW